MAFWSEFKGGAGRGTGYAFGTIVGGAIISAGVKYVTAKISKSSSKSKKKKSKK